MIGQRVYVAGIRHEGHSFSPLCTHLEDFVVESGDALLDRARQVKTALGGAVRTLERSGMEILPGTAAFAGAGGPVVDDVFEDIKRRIVRQAAESRPDAVFLELHGAMVTESLEDPEGDLLGAVRSVVGPKVPIACALDLHAHVTPAMLRVADICLACKENPHTDLDVAGSKAADLLLKLMRGALRPMTVLARVPLILAHQIATTDAPLAEVHVIRREAEARYPGIADISICNTQAYLDAEGAGQCVSVIVDEGSASLRSAEGVAECLASALWDRRDRFASDLPTLDDTLAEVAGSSKSMRPFVLGDQGDRVLAGAPGDGTRCLNALLDRWPHIRAVLPVTDPMAVAAAADAGVGNAVDMALGGGFSVAETPVRSAWRVVRLTDGKFVQKGPYLAGEPAVSGDTAVLESGNVQVIATSLPLRSQDTEAYVRNGIDLTDYDLIVTKSGFHFRLSFADIGTCRVAGTPGLTNYVPGLLPYRLRRPIFPEDAGVSETPIVEVFSAPSVQA